MRHILVPCDFSLPAQEAFRFALNIAKKSGGVVNVLKVIELPMLYETTFGMQPFGFDARVLQQLDAEARAKFEEMQKAYVVDVPVSFQSVHGPVTPTIRAFIENNPVDLVVMGTHGSSGLEEFFIGSNTERIVRFSKVPVLAIRKAVEVASVKSIVLPVVPDPDHAYFINNVKSLQRFFNAQLQLLFINKPSESLAVKEAKDELEKYVKLYDITNYTLNVRTHASEPDGIINFADEIGADMIAMGTHGRKGLAHFIGGSITEDVVNHVDCPIWTCSLKDNTSSYTLETEHSNARVESA